MFEQLHEDSKPNEARLNLGIDDITDVVLIITLIAGKLQFKLISGSIFGSTNVVPH